MGFDLCLNDQMPVGLHRDLTHSILGTAHIQHYFFDLVSPIMKVHQML